MNDILGALRTKTGKAGLAAILTAIAGYLTGDLSWIQAIFAGLAGLGTMTARAAIDKNGPIIAKVDTTDYKPEVHTGPLRNPMGK